MVDGKLPLPRIGRPFELVAAGTCCSFSLNICASVLVSTAKKLLVATSIFPEGRLYFRGIMALAAPFLSASMFCRYFSYAALTKASPIYRRSDAYLGATPDIIL